MATKKQVSKARATAPATTNAAVPPTDTHAESLPTNTVPIVAIGASAGGLEAFEQFFRTCPTDIGMAFVLVPHLDPAHESLLTEILQRATAMPVVQALDQIAVELNHVYVIPPNRDMAILHGQLQLSEPEQARGMRMPIDLFFRSLAEDQAEKAIGIILSGTATDGTLGLRAILGAGGVCMVQEPTTAKYDGMPKSAIAAGYATHVLPVDKMPEKLRELVQQSSFRQKVPRILPKNDESAMNQILMRLRSVTSHDFALYKKSTIARRIERRMAQHNIEDLSIYARYLKENPAEVQTLFKELLINVTSFFRDPEAFVVLKQEILPQLLEGKSEDYTLRVWVAACASGEEAYSIAILLREFVSETHKTFKIQIYATDLDEDAIAVARIGSYPPNIIQDVTPERLQRFFIKDETGYKVKKDIREMVVFAVQSVIKDPPFTKLDLLSCRNLLIYLEQEQQNRLIPSFHYALKPDGVLFLSPSESITSHPELFPVINRKWKIYRASHTLTEIQSPPFEPSPWMDKAAKAPNKMVINKARTDNVADLSNRILLQSYAPASVTTDSKGNILYIHGDTSRYLSPPPGPVTTNIIEMAREGLQLEMRTALLNAVTQAAPTLDQEVLLKTDGGGLTTVSFSVRLLPALHLGAGGNSVANAVTNSEANSESGEKLLLFSFKDIKSDQPTDKSPTRRSRTKRTALSDEAKRSEQLERELAYAKENLQSTIEEQQATNEELKSTNEELQSTNEELQSSNEELETSKEELQSLNEETITVNSELNTKIEQLSDIQNDMKNLLDSISTGTLFLDHHLVIRRYTREAAKLYCLVATDVGRSLRDIKSTIESEDLLAALQSVLDTLIPCDREVHTTDGAWYLARMQPYRTLDNIIEGVVLTFTDITESREARRLKLGVVQLARELAEGIVNSVIEPLIVLDGDLQVVSASRSFYQHFQVTAEETVGRKIYALGNGQWDIPALRNLLENILPQDQVMEGYVVEHDFPSLGRRRMVLNARRIVTAVGNTDFILLAMVAIETLEKP